MYCIEVCNLGHRKCWTMITYSKRRFHFLDCEHQRPRTLTLIWGLIVSPTQLCHTRVGIKGSTQRFGLSESSLLKFMTLSLCVNAGSFQDASVIQHAYNLNFPLRSIQYDPDTAPWSAFSVTSAAVILETVKQVKKKKVRKEMLSLT